MKSYIIGLALFILFMAFTIFQADYNRHQEQIQELKYIAEEVAAAAAQYIILNKYREGYLVFNQTAGDLAAFRMVQRNMELDTNLKPSLYSDWQGPITYNVDYYDDLNADYPHELLVAELGQVLTITAPTVVVTINGGRANYRFYQDPPDIIALAAHEWRGR